jgi:hypothetical protein
MLTVENFQMTRITRPVESPLHSRNTSPPSSNLRRAKKKLTTTLAKSKIESTHSKQTIYEISNRNKNALFRNAAWERSGDRGALEAEQRQPARRQFPKQLAGLKAAATYRDEKGGADQDGGEEDSTGGGGALGVNESDGMERISSLKAAAPAKPKKLLIVRHGTKFV